MSSKERLMAAVAVAYHGLPVEYHLRLAERLMACIIDSVEDMDVEEAVSRIKYHGEQVKAIHRKYP